MVIECSQVENTKEIFSQFGYLKQVHFLYLQREILIVLEIQRIMKNWEFRREKKTTDFLSLIPLEKKDSPY